MPPTLDDTEIVSRFLLERKIDLVLAEYGTTAATITHACKHSGIPLVSHFHGFDAFRHDVIKAYADAYREMFAYASSVVVVSTDMRRQLIELGCPASKLVVTPCGPEAAFMDINPARNSNRVLSVGRLVEKKGPHLLIRAFQKALTSHPDLHLTLVGDGPMRSTCEMLIESLALGGSVHMTGSATSEQIRGHMNEAFLFAQHSLVASDGDSEGTPVAIMEASAAALPVVATRHAGIPDVIVEGETGILVDEHDVDAMGKAIGALANDRDRATAMGMRGRERIKKNFTLESHIASLSNVLRSAAMTSPRAGT
jgi:colanic acid/amylovoran biosynthesis glycosyltransferase